MAIKKVDTIIKKRGYSYQKMWIELSKRGYTQRFLLKDNIYYNNE